MEAPNDEIPISEARSNITDVVASVRLLRRCIFLTRRSKPQAAIVPVELGTLVKQAGGPDAAAEILSSHLRQIRT